MAVSNKELAYMVGMAIATAFEWGMSHARDMDRGFINGTDHTRAEMDQLMNRLEEIFDALAPSPPKPRKKGARK